MRIVNRLLAFVVALSLVGVGVILVIEVIAARAHSGPVIIHWHAILHWAHRNTWKAGTVELTSAVTAAGGLLLLLPQLFRRRVSRLRIDTAAGTDAAISRKGVTVTIRGAVAEVEGVANSRVKIGQRRIRVKALSTALEGDVAAELRPRVAEAVSQQLEALNLHKPRRLRVAVNGRTGRRSGGSKGRRVPDAR